MENLPQNTTDEIIDLRPDGTKRPTTEDVLGLLQKDGVDLVLRLIKTS